MARRIRSGDWSAPERRGNCGRPCAEPRQKEEKRRREARRPAGSQYIRRRTRLLNIHASARMLYALCAFFHKPATLLACAARCPTATPAARSWPTSTPRPRPRGEPGPRPGTLASPTSALQPADRSGSSRSARRRCRWPRPRWRPCARAGSEPAGGLIVAARAGLAPASRLRVVRRRPSRSPGRGSLAAAEALGAGGRALGPTTRSGCCSPAAPPACSARRWTGIAPARAHRALRPAARLRPRHHRDEPDPQALLALGRRPARRGARAGPGSGLRRLRRHRRRPRLDRLRAPASPTPPPRLRSDGLLERAGLWDRIPERPPDGSLLASRSGGNSRNAKARRPGLRARDPRADRQ